MVEMVRGRVFGWLLASAASGTAGEGGMKDINSVWLCVCAFESMQTLQLRAFGFRRHGGDVGFWC